jgi:hypothetical protein
MIKPIKGIISEPASMPYFNPSETVFFSLPTSITELTCTSVELPVKPES